MSKIKNIEFLRIVFMFAVVLMHYTAKWAKLIDVDSIGHIAKHFSNGGKAVDGFFIISGFLLYFTLKNSTTIIDFIKKKILRLSPVIIFSVIVGFIASLFGLMKFSFHSALMTMTFTNVLADMSIGNWDELAVTWYVSVLFWVSLLYFYLMKNFDKKYTNLAIGILSVVSYYVALKAHQGSLGNPHATFLGIINLGFLRGFGGIGLGYFIAQWYKDNYNAIVNKICSVKEQCGYTFLEIIFLVAVFLELFILNSQHKYNFAIVIDIAILFILFLLKRGYVSQFLDNNFVASISKYTYSIYIIHMLLFKLLSSIIVQFVDCYYLFPILFIAVIVFGVITYHFVEAPCARYLKKKWFV